MKAKDIIKAVDCPEEECNICHLHKKAEKLLQDRNVVKITCPHCNESIDCDWDNFDPYGHDIQIVGETNMNMYDDNEEINACPIGQCSKCGERFAFMPTPIIYNANHDIYYTGGKHDLTKSIDNKKIKESILPLIKNYTDRIKSGEKTLNENNLYTWIEYEIEHLIAEYLYDNGLKR